MTTKTTSTTKITKPKKAALSKGKAKGGTGNPERFAFRITLETYGIGQFGLPKTKRTYSHGCGNGRYGIDATTQAATRAEEKQALPNYAPTLGDGWDAKALVMHAVRIADWVKLVDASSFSDADKIQIEGAHQLAREIAVQIGRADAADEGELFLKVWLCLNWTEATDVPHSASIANYLEQMISRDCASLGLDV